jgi:hypothetical protein
MPWGDLVDDATSHHLISNFAPCPLADRTLRWHFTGHRDQPARLLNRDLAFPARAWSIIESTLHEEIRSRNGLQGQPACAPGAHCLHTHAQFTRDLAIILACMGFQDGCVLSKRFVGW